MEEVIIRAAVKKIENELKGRAHNMSTVQIRDYALSYLSEWGGFTLRVKSIIVNRVLNDLL